MSAYTIIAYRGERLPEAYQGLVFSKWLRSFRYGNDYMRLSDRNSYYREYHRYISQVLSSPSCVARFAVLVDDFDVVLGFSVARDHILDYVHVHKDNRRVGIGTSLVPEGITTITHLTKTALTIWGSKYAAWKFDPFGK